MKVLDVSLGYRIIESLLLAPYVTVSNNFFFFKNYGDDTSFYHQTNSCILI